MSDDLAGTCKMCGKCCEAIHIPFTPDKIEEMAKDSWNKEFRFVAENWVPISKEEAYSINPHFSLMESLGVDYSHMSFYTCKQFDKETRLCEVHDSRPYVCSGYPWYGREPRHTEPFYTMDCGYKIDVEKGWKWNAEQVSNTR